MASSSENNICFVSNFTKTYLFHEVGKKLAENGVGVYWIAVNKDYYNFLLQHYPAQNILYINLSYINVPAPAVGEFKINELFYGDRFLKHNKDGLKFLTHIQKPIFDFLQKNAIRFVFGEATWAHELLIHRICSLQELNCTYLSPHTIRIPNGRFAFYTDEYQSEMYVGKNKEQEQAFDYNIEKPDYLKLNDAILKKKSSLSARLKKIKYFLTSENIDPLDPSLLKDRLVTFKIKGQEELNKERYKSIKKVALGAVKDKKFVLITLHKQPEASIDVVGRYYEDQVQNIKNIWRSLPHDWLLLVKEHTNAIGDRSYAFYTDLLKLERLFFLEEKTDSYQAILSSELVVTVSGTIAYEAALMGKPSFTFADCFFNKMKGCKKINLDDLRHATSLQTLIEKPTDVSEFKKFVIDNSYKGIISDYLSNPACMEDDNIKAIATAINSLI